MRNVSGVLLGLFAAAVLSVPAGATPMTIEVALSPALEVPPVVSDASGTAFLTFDPDDPSAGIAFQIELETITTALLQAHIHAGGPGEIGAVIATLFELCDLEPDGCDGDPGEIEITGEQLNLAGGATEFGSNTFADIIAAMRAGNAYINIHTEGFVTGELRGNIPEPATALLFGSGLMGLEVFARRCKHRG